MFKQTVSSAHFSLGFIVLVWTGVGSEHRTCAQSLEHMGSEPSNMWSELRTWAQSLKHRVRASNMGSELRTWGQSLERGLRASNMGSEPQTGGQSLKHGVRASPRPHPGNYAKYDNTVDKIYKNQ